MTLGQVSYSLYVKIKRLQIETICSGTVYIKTVLISADLLKERREDDTVGKEGLG